MKIEKLREPKPAAAAGSVTEPPRGPVPPLFRRLDWWTAAGTALLVFLVYFWTVAPDVTLEDSGELAVASDYLGVPHPPGYPIWTMYTWLFTVLVPISNIAWRVALSSAVAGALACGLLALLVSRGSSMLLEGIEELKRIEPKLESWICSVAGFLAGTLLGFNGFMWSQAVIVEVYTLSVLSFVAVLCFLLRWIYAPHQRRYLYWAFFMFGICFTNHQTLIVAAMGIEVAILAADSKLGRDLLLGNSVAYLAGLALKAAGLLTAFDANPAVFMIYNVIGLASVAGWAYLTFTTRVRMEDWLVLGRDVLLAIAVGYALTLLLIGAQVMIISGRSGTLKLLHLAGWGSIAGCAFLAGKAGKLNMLKWPAWAQAAAAYGTLYVFIGFLTSFRTSNWFNSSVGIFLTHHLLGWVAIGTVLGYVGRKGGLGSEIRVMAAAALAWFVGAAMYFYMPISSMTNPPMNWGYARTVDGFWHALSRGQYDKTNPTDSLFKFIDQLVLLFEGAESEFGLVFLLIGVVPFLFFLRMQRRERAWLIGLTAIYLCLAVLLLILLNPMTDLQSRKQSRVFFTASHIVVAILIGYGAALLAGVFATQYERFRAWILRGAAAVVGLELYSLVQTYRSDMYPPVPVAGAVLGFGLALGFALLVFVRKTQLPMGVVLLIFLASPLRSLIVNWSANEQRGHLFGYWFGHDMFRPPFDVYPDMEHNAILFGGTDPGRFNPTYMIFSESLLPASKKRDPDFDRRDVYLITQNALADQTYLSYIRAHYNRSTQVDPPFFSEFFRSEAERLQGRTNLIARAFVPFDRFLLRWGAEVEAERRERGVYPAKEIYTPTPLDSSIAFRQYVEDAQRRLHLNQLKPGENVRLEDGMVQVSGQTAVMAINGLLTKVIFDRNPTNEFYLEESFPLDWMFPHLTPYGIILKINREPLVELTDEVVERDHEFWSQFSERLIGNWITYETPVKEVCDFAIRTYISRDYTGFSGDRKFIRDEFAQKAFSKLRSAIGGLYIWRLGQSKHGGEQQRMVKAADFALRQAFAFCPYSAEVVYKYVSLLATLNRIDDAMLVVQTALRFDPNSGALVGLENQLVAMKAQMTGLGGSTSPAPAAVTNPGAGLGPVDPDQALPTLMALVQSGQTSLALQLIDQIVVNTNIDPGILMTAAQYSAQLGDASRLGAVLTQVRARVPELEQRHAQVPENIPLAFQLISAYLMGQETNKALEMLDQLVADPNADLTTLFSASQAYGQLEDAPRLEATLKKMVDLMPSNPEAWYNLAAVQAVVRNNTNALASLAKAVQLSSERLAIQPSAQDLRTLAAGDARFSALRTMPGYEEALSARTNRTRATD